MPIQLPPISRRRFLAGSLAAGAGLLLPERLLAQEVPADPNRFALLSDTHIWEHRDRENRGIKPAEKLAAARKEILTLAPRPAAMLICGDCAYNQGNAGDYAVLAEEVRPIREAGIPIHFVLGNHDNLENFYAAFPDAKPKGDPPLPGEHVGVVASPHADWVLLDSLQRSNHTPGRIGTAQLKWLAEWLDARPKRPALVMAHHNPDRGPKPSGLVDTDALFEVLSPRRQAKAYFYGHSHAWSHAKREDGIHLVNLPTLVWLFDKTQPRAWVDAQLRPDGIALVLNALDKSHPRHGQKLELKWRA